MIRSIEVLFAPAEFARLPQRDMRGAVCVVFDILRATTTMTAAIANGARGVIPVIDIPEALRLRKQNAKLLLAGERHGLRISAEQANGTAFDLGNSPREFLPQVVSVRVIVSTTTNGTRALRACVGARKILPASFLNLAATVNALRRQLPRELILVCSGTGEEAAWEDTLAAGALVDLLRRDYGDAGLADSARAALAVWQLEKRKPLAKALGAGKNGQRLLGLKDLKPDVAYCARRDTVDFALVMNKAGMVVKAPVK